MRPTKLSYTSIVGLITILALAMIFTACSSQATPEAHQAEETMENMTDSEGMDGMDMGDAPSVPAGMAYLDGQEIRFIHTEVSDADVAKLLTDMMASPVLTVPSLAKASPEMLAFVYVFKNGVEGMGPLGFQPDVFDNPPGSDGYTPLRKIVFVTWAEGTKARELKSLAEVKEAESKGELTLEESGVVVNMPFITWPGGTR